MTTLDVNIKLLRDGAKIPTAATSQSAGYDLTACIDQPYELSCGEIHSFPCGIAIAPASVPNAENIVGLIFGRSGLGAKHGVTLANSVGVIDSDYRGEISVTLINRGPQPYTVSPGDRIAQLVFMPFYSANFTLRNELDSTERGNGGFGSTGKN